MRISEYFFLLHGVEIKRGVGRRVFRIGMTVFVLSPLKLKIKTPGVSFLGFDISVWFRIYRALCVRVSGIWVREDGNR